MILRHITIPVILASVLLCGCGKEKPTDVPESISFAPGVSVMTKSMKPDDPTVLFTVGNEAAIYGTRVVGLESRTIFSNRPLRCSEVTSPTPPATAYAGTWNYTPLEYWEDTGDYYFTGVFPGSLSSSIDNTYYLNVSYLSGTNTDVMVARKYRDASASKAPVELEFKHATSAVRFLFGKDSSSDSDRFSLTSFQLENIAPSGTFKVLTRITNPDLDPFSVSNWTNLGAVTTICSWSSDSSEDWKSITHPSDEDDPDGYTPMGWYYMVPQALNTGARVRFSVSYNDGTPVETVIDIYGVRDQNSDFGYSWSPNCVYNYFITLTQSGVDLTVTTTPWNEVNATTDDITFEG